MKIKRPILFVALLSFQASIGFAKSHEQHENLAEPRLAQTAEDLSGEVVEDLMKELRRKNVNMERWGAISKNFSKLTIGMSEAHVELLLGKRDVFPEDRSIWQYAPDEFRGGWEAPDWNLIVHMEDGKVSGFQLLKFVYGPPPGNIELCQ